jgi:hypothetical protein
MSFMIKIAFALPLTFAAALGHGTSTSAPAEQATPDPVLSRATCSVCDEVYDSCIAEGITPAGCHRMTANCYKNCILP